MLSNWIPPKTGTICSDHFLNNDFQNWSTSRRTLKETAIPSIYIVYSTLPINLVEHKNKTSNEICKGEQNDKATVNVPMTDIAHMVEKQDEVAELSKCSPHSQKVDSSTSISPKRIFSTAKETAT